MAVCKYHRDRPGIGVCVRCRAVICQACCTRVDGINHCHACLKALGRTPQRRPAGAGLAVAAGLAGLVAAWLVFLALFWQIQGWLAP